MKTKILALLFTIMLIGCSGDDYYYSGNLTFKDVSTGTTVFVRVLGVEVSIMTITNLYKSVELIPGHYKALMYNATVGDQFVNFQIIAGKTTIIRYNGKGYDVTYK